MSTLHRHIKFRKRHIKIVVFIVFEFGFNAGLWSQSFEYTMKAVALEKLSLFISWPASTVKNYPTHEFVIAVFDQISFGEILKEVYKEKKIKDRKVKIVNLKSIQELTECQMLFIPTIKFSELNKVLSFVKGKSILTISDTEGFAEAGCFINLYEFENKLRFEINQRGMKEAGFTVDYRLLKVSKVLNPVIE